MCKVGGGFVDTMEKTCNKCELLDKRVANCDQSQFTSLLELFVNHCCVIKKLCDLSPLACRKELQNNIQVLLVYIFALTLLDARFACLLATPLSLDFILVRTLVNFHLNLLNAIILFFFVHIYLFLLSATSLASLHLLSLCYFLALSRLVIVLEDDFYGRRSQGTEGEADWFR